MRLRPWVLPELAAVAEMLTGTVAAVTAACWATFVATFIAIALPPAALAGNSLPMSKTTAVESSCFALSASDFSFLDDCVASLEEVRLSDELSLSCPLDVLEEESSSLAPCSVALARALDESGACSVEGPWRPHCGRIAASRPAPMVRRSRPKDWRRAMAPCSARHWTGRNSHRFDPTVRSSRLATVPAADSHQTRSPLRRSGLSCPTAQIDGRHSRKCIHADYWHFVLLALGSETVVPWR